MTGDGRSGSAAPADPQFRTPHSALPPAGGRVHFIGVGGIGTSALARVLHLWGYRVSGSDAAASDVTAALVREGIAVAIGHRAEAVRGADLVVYSAAVGDDNPELAAARAAGLPTVKRAALLGLLADARVGLAVTGTHGKSTTSAMLAKICVDAGRDPTFFIGAVLQDFGTNARPGGGELVVVEADEYDRSFLHLHPLVAVVTSVEHDHPDTYPTYGEMLEAYSQFLGQVRPAGAILLSADDPGCAALRALVEGGRVALAPGAAIIRYGRAPEAAWRLVPGADGAETVFLTGVAVATLTLRVPGEHNRRNALAALAAAAHIGIGPAAAAASLAGFSGIGRRLELKGEAGDITVIDSYAHHPTEIVSDLRATRERYPGRLVWIVFQPHTYSRTKLLLREFADALAGADRLVLLDIYAARERDTLGVSADDIAALLPQPGAVLRAPSPAAAAALLLDRRRMGDLLAGAVVLTLGAGDVWQAGEGLLDGL